MSTLFFASRRASVRLMTISAAAAQRSLGGTVHTIAACGPVDKKIVIIGGGTGGVGVAAQLLNAGLKNVTIIEPKREIYYQPLWTLVAAGLKKNTDSVKPLTAVVPRGSVLVQKAVTEIDPAKNTVVMRDGSCIKYDFLVVAAGIQIDWGKIPGLVSALEDTVGKRSVVSIYDYDYSAAAWEVFKAALRREGCSSRMLFTMPNTPIKCAGAPQKIMWLVEEMLDQKMRKECSVEFWIPGTAMFGVKKYADLLEQHRIRRGVGVQYMQELVSVDGEAHTAVFKCLSDGTLSTQTFDVLHVTPPMSAPDFLKRSPLADAGGTGGWMAVDKHTLQSTKYDNVFGLGDCTNTPNSKTAAAIMAQAPVLVHNLTARMNQTPLDGRYEGYASCPITLGRGKVLLAEFGYDGKIMETFSPETGKFPLNLVGLGPVCLQRRLFYTLKTTLFPFAYWYLWPAGYWFGTSGIFRPNVVPMVPKVPRVPDGKKNK